MGAGTMIDGGGGLGRAIGGGEGKTSSIAAGIGVGGILLLLLLPLLWSPDPDPFWPPVVSSRKAMSAIPRLRVSAVVVLDSDSFSAVKNAVSVDVRELTPSSNADEQEIALFRPPLDFGRNEEGVAGCAAAGYEDVLVFEIALEDALSTAMSAGPDLALDSADAEAGSGNMGMGGK